MHLVSLNVAGLSHPGIMVDEDVLDLQACAAVVPAAHCIPRSIKGILRAGPAALDLVRALRQQILEGKDSLRERLRGTGALINRERAQLLAPLPDPGMILAAGMNYREHLREMNTPVPEHPVAFIKSSAAVIGPEEPIVLPRSCPDMVDWEGELSAVFGRTCHNASAADALDYIAGYTIINDVSARDWVGPLLSAQGAMGSIHAWERNLLGKQFPTFCPLGPALVTRDEIPNPGALRLTTTLNDRVMQAADTSDLVFGLPRLIEYYSRFYRFTPGDIITTGSPAGVGYARDPKVFLRAGDAIAVTVQGIGVLANRVVAS